MKEVKKYFLRFGIILLLPFLIILFTNFDKFYLFAYKISLTTIGVGLSELIWIIFFKPVYGSTERMTNERLLPIMLFRGLLYSSIILALTLGL